MPNLHQGGNKVLIDAGCPCSEVRAFGNVGGLRKVLQTIVVLCVSELRSAFNCKWAAGKAFSHSVG